MAVLGHHTGDLLTLIFLPLIAVNRHFVLRRIVIISIVSQSIDCVMSTRIFILRSENLSSIFFDSLTSLDVYVEKPNKLR